MAFGSGLDGSYSLGIRMGIIARFTAVKKVGGHAAIGRVCRLIVAVSPYFEKGKSKD